MLNKNRLSDKDLRTAFLRLNRVYFNGKLPKDTEVRYDRGDKNDRSHLGGALGVTYQRHFRILFGPKGKVSDPIYVILLAKKHQNSRRLTLSTLIHEMVHVKTWYTTANRACDLTNWNNFNKESLRLAKMGAFNGLW